jgi:hypothetical protein
VRFPMMRSGAHPMIAHPIAIIRREHDGHTNRLWALEHISHGHTPPPKAPTGRGRLSMPGRKPSRPTWSATCIWRTKRCSPASSIWTPEGGTATRWLPRRASARRRVAGGMRSGAGIRGDWRPPPPRQQGHGDAENVGTRDRAAGHGGRLRMNRRMPPPAQPRHTAFGRRGRQARVLRLGRCGLSGRACVAIVSGRPDPARR